MIVQEKLNLKEKISEIKNKSSLFTKLSDDEIRFQSEKLKKKAESFKTFRGPLANAFIIEYFAIIQEISFRVSGLKHFDNQLLAGLLLNEGKIVEMKTGEGKTLASSLPIALNALSKKGVHVVTVNEYLAERDQKWMGKIFESLGLSVGLVKNGMTLKKKAKNYKKDITYLTNSELVFDIDLLNDSTHACTQLNRSSSLASFEPASDRASNGRVPVAVPPHACFGRFVHPGRLIRRCGVSTADESRNQSRGCGNTTDTWMCTTSYL